MFTSVAGSLRPILDAVRFLIFAILDFNNLKKMNHRIGSGFSSDVVIKHYYQKQLWGRCLVYNSRP